MATYQIFKFKHPKTGKIFSDFRNIKDAEKIFTAPDNVVCEPYNKYMGKNYKSGVVIKDAEVFEKYPEYCKEMNPKYVRFRDNHKERYDPNKHY